MKSEVPWLGVNQSSVRMPRAFLRQWIGDCLGELRKRKIRLPGESPLVVVFLDVAAARKMNLEFRGRDYATDVLSFDAADAGWGELVICPQVVRRQAREHGLSFRKELGYMVLHGMLHLLGYDHETGEKDARRMFRLQDEIFEKLR